MQTDDIIFDAVEKEAENIGKNDNVCPGCYNTDIRTCMKCGKIRQTRD